MLGGITEPASLCMQAGGGLSSSSRSVVGTIPNTDKKLTYEAAVYVEKVCRLIVEGPVQGSSVVVDHDSSSGTEVSNYCWIKGFKHATSS